jgi:hypothetical protein
MRVVIGAIRSAVAGQGWPFSTNTFHAALEPVPYCESSSRDDGGWPSLRVGVLGIARALVVYSHQCSLR